MDIYRSKSTRKRFGDSKLHYNIDLTQVNKKDIITNAVDEMVEINEINENDGNSSEDEMAVGSGSGSDNDNDNVGSAYNSGSDMLTDGDAPPTPTQRHETIRSQMWKAEDLDAEESGVAGNGIKVENVNEIGFDGKKIGKRKKGEAKRVSAKKKRDIHAAADNNELIKITDEENMHDKNTKYATLAGKEPTYAPYLYNNVDVLNGYTQRGQALPNGTGQITLNKDDLNGINGIRIKGIDLDAGSYNIDDFMNNGNTSDTNGNGNYNITVRNTFDNVHVNTFKKVFTKPKESITLVIFELENVLCTNMKLISQQTVSDIENTDLQRMILAFGGEERLEKLHELFCDTILTEAQHACFLLTNERSKPTIKALERCDLAQYFASKNVGRKGKVQVLSHVIGNNHKLLANVQHKKHLFLLRLIKVMLHFLLCF